MKSAPSSPCAVAGARISNRATEQREQDSERWEDCMNVRGTTARDNCDCDGGIVSTPAKAPTVHQFPPVPWSKGAAWATRDTETMPTARRVIAKSEDCLNVRGRDNFNRDGTASTLAKAPAIHQFPPVPWSKGATWSTRGAVSNTNSEERDVKAKRANW